MLLSLTRIGATRQCLDKSVAVLGADPARVIDQVARSATSAQDVHRIAQVGGTNGLFVVRQPMAWAGTRAARDQVFTGLARSVELLAHAARSAGGFLAPTAVGLSGRPAVFGGDTHVFEVLTPVEQEVFCNLLRSKVPVLIAMAGRGTTAANSPRDRIGSRWLTSSRSHLASRFVASTTPEHLERVKAELRRRDGVARLDRMDVVPDQAFDNGLSVTVRCIDAAASLAVTRAHMIVLAALGLRARRLVRDGKRIGHSPQRQLEENRARAVADGLRARFTLEDRTGRPRQGQTKQVRQVEGRAAVRELLLDLCPEFGNLDVAVEELMPVVLPVELPRLGLRRFSTEADLLASWAAGGESTLVRAAGDELRNPVPGGFLLAQATQAAPGRTSVVMDLWRANIAGERKDNAQRHGRDKDQRGERAHRGQRTSGRHHRSDGGSRGDRAQSTHRGGDRRGGRDRDGNA